MSVLLEIMNIGAAANDDTGDTFRNAFDKTNRNFAALNKHKATSSITVAQPGHGFAVMNALYISGSTYAKALANDRNTLGVMVVTEVIDANSFVLSVCGVVEGLPGLIAGQYYYVSDVSPGVLTTIEPVVAGNFSNPLLLALSGTQGVVLPFRPTEI